MRCLIQNSVNRKYIYNNPKHRTSKEDLAAIPFTEEGLKNLIKEGVKEAVDEQKENEDQNAFIEKAKGKYYEAYTDLAKIVKETQGKFNIGVDNRKLNEEKYSLKK